METYFESPVYLWFLIPIIILVVAEVVLRTKPWWLMGTRVLWLAPLLFLLADLTVIQSQEVSQPARLMVVYDRSDSVALLPERVERVHTFVSELQEWADRENQEFRLYSLAEDLQEEDPDNLSWGGMRTDARQLEKLDGFDDSMIVFLSDGVYNRQPRLRTVTHTIQLGHQGEKDVWIDNYRPVLTAFLRNRVTIPFEIAQRGFDGESVTVDLMRGTQILESKEVRLQGRQQNVEFSYFPDRMGEEVFELRVRALPEEISDLNNRVSFVMRTVRDKIQVLHISGKPSPDLLAWRGFLTRQPDVDLVSFYILRSIQDDPRARGQELSLIPFPYDELFTTELEKFDVVILQNFNFSLYFQPFYLVNLARFVREGGALLMLGGDQSFQSYALSPLSEMLPFRYGDSRGRFEEGTFQTRVEQEHPVIHGLEPLFEAFRWEGRHHVEAHDSAQNLVMYEDGRPFLSFRDVGSGRVVSINTDESWRLHMQGVPDYAFSFGRLSRRLMQYLTFDPEMDPVQIESEVWRTGTSVRIQKVDGEVSNWRIRDTRDAEWSFEVENESEVDYFVETPGVYEVWNSEVDRTFIYATEEKPWRDEWKFLISNDENLKELSSQTEGTALRFQERGRAFDSTLRGQEILSADRRAWALSSGFRSWTLLLAVILLFCTDLFFRKRFRWDS